jgi:DNA-binding IclR family transcriptional regulator
MASSISKSVARAFEVLECFKETRAPFTASEITRRLNYPHSSGVAVLKVLTELGYLTYDRIKRTYFPAQKLHRLGIWVQSALIGSSGLTDTAQAICQETGETTAITSRSFIFNHIIHVQKPQRPLAIDLPVGVGIALCNSIVGRVILSQMTDKEIERIYRFTTFWAKKQKTQPVPPFEDVTRAVAFVRKNNYLAGYDQWLEGVGAIAYPLKAPFEGYPLAIGVSGPTPRIRASEANLRRTIARILKV